MSPSSARRPETHATKPLLLNLTATTQKRISGFAEACSTKIRGLTSHRSNTCDDLTPLASTAWSNMVSSIAPAPVAPRSGGAPFIRICRERVVSACVFAQLADGTVRVCQSGLVAKLNHCKRHKHC